MCGEDEGASRRGVELFDEVEDPGGGDRVEVGCWFVSENELRLAGHGTGDGHALPLPTGKLIGTLERLPGEADLVEPVLDALAALARREVLQQERILDVLVCGEDRDEVERLEDEAQRVATCRSETMQRDVRDIDAVDHDAPAVRLGVWFVKAADEIEQRRLAAAGGAGQSEEIAAADVERDTGEGTNVHAAEAVSAGDIG